MRKNKIAAVVVTYNRKELLMENLEALLAQKEKRFDILVIDNHSTDGTRDDVEDFIWMRGGTFEDITIPEAAAARSGSAAQTPGSTSAHSVQAGTATQSPGTTSAQSGQVAAAAQTPGAGNQPTPPIFYINTGSNLGGAGGFSYGIQRAVEAGYSYVWLMDDDCIPQPEALDRLCAAAKRQHGRFGFLSSKTLWKDGELCRMNVQRRSLFHNLDKFPEEKSMADNGRGSDIPIVIASFVSMMIPASVIRRVGLPIAQFFIWTDDWEYSRRISRHYPCFAVADSEVVHKTSENVGTSIATDRADRLWRYRLAYRNEVVLYRREGVRGWLHILVRTPLHIARVLLKAKDHRVKRILMILRGTLDGCTFFPGIKSVQVRESYP